MSNQTIIGVAILATLGLALPCVRAAENKTVWLDEMNLSTAISGWGTTQAKKSIEGKPLTLRGKVYERGIGTHAAAVLRVDLDQRGVRFKALTGVDDESNTAGSVEFRVTGDGKLLWSSGVLRGGGELKSCDVDLTGVKNLDLVVDTTPDGYNNDHADWADARIEYQGDKAPVTLAAPAPPIQQLPGNSASAQPPDFQISNKVSISVPDKAIEESFAIATGVVVQMRSVAYKHYGYDGWFATSYGKTQPWPPYDIRDYRYYPKCAAYLWGDDPLLLPQMGKRIFFDQHDGTGRLTWDPQGQCGIHIAHVAKHFSDYLRYAEQDAFVKDNWQRLLRIVKWSLATYDRNEDGLIEHGEQVPTRLWGLLIGEPYNGFDWDQTQNDVVVVASMEMCELLQLLASYGEANKLPEAGWLRSKATQSRDAIEKRAWDPLADYYYLLERAAEKRWYHSGRGIDEKSRELDVTPYYAAFVSGEDARGRKVAEYARHVLMDLNVFPMPLMYPLYFWGKYEPERFIPGGCFEESYYNCVRAFSKYGMLDALFTAIKRRSDAHARDKDCFEWYMPDGTNIGYWRDRYGISGAAHISAIIEGLFGILPTQFGFNEVNIWPAIPQSWADHPATISVTLPDSGFLKYTYQLSKAPKTVKLTLETNKERAGHFRIPIAGHARLTTWNGKPIQCDLSPQADGRGEWVRFNRSFDKAVLEIEIE